MGWVVTCDLDREILVQKQNFHKRKEIVLRTDCLYL
jgi:hypothetical protein